MIGNPAAPGLSEPKTAAGGGAGVSAGRGGYASIEPVPLAARLTGEGVSIVAMALATIALGTALYLHFGVEPWIATSAAIAAYICMLAVHAMMPRHFAVERPAGMRPAFEKPLEPNWQGIEPSPQTPRTGAPKSAAPHSPVLGEAARAATESGATAAKPGSQPSLLRRRRPTNDQSAGQIQRSENAGQKQEPSLQAGRHSDRPAALAATEPEMPPAARQARAPELGRTPAQDSQAGRRPPREADVEMIQGLIKKLADEVNASTMKRDGETGEARAAAEKVIAASVGALKTTAESMRASEDAARRSQAVAPDANAPRRPPAASAKLSALAEALTAGRVEVLLDPIVDFNASRPRHFEVFVRLRDGAGNVLDAQARDGDLGGSGMLPRLDGARVAHAAQIAMRFGERADALFSTVSGEALGTDKFLDGVAAAYRTRHEVAGQLVLTFAQSDVRGFGTREWRALEGFARLGFRYALADVSDLDMDFEELAEKGFDFVKLDAEVFLKGLPAGADVVIPASDICRHLAGLGISVIVGRMTDEYVAAKIFGFGVLYGQGTLFGGPKAVRRDVLTGGGGQSAA